jgi:acyl carrier protein
METDVIITRFIQDELLRGDWQVLPEPNGSLISTGILDSSAVLKLLIFIEERFSLKIDDQEVTPGNFESVNRITAFIESKRDKDGNP